jgi:hypothetical protein
VHCYVKSTFVDYFLESPHFFCCCLSFFWTLRFHEKVCDERRRVRPERGTRHKFSKKNMKAHKRKQTERPVKTTATRTITTHTSSSFQIQRGKKRMANWSTSQSHPTTAKKRTYKKGCGRRILKNSGFKTETYFAWQARLPHGPSTQTKHTPHTLATIREGSTAGVNDTNIPPYDNLHLRITVYAQKHTHYPSEKKKTEARKERNCTRQSQ